MAALPPIPMSWLVDAVIVVMLLEGLALIAWRVRSGRGPAAADLLANLAAGLCLLLALRSVLGGGGTLPCAGWLAAAGLAHATDLWRRWPRRRSLPS